MRSRSALCLDGAAFWKISLLQADRVRGKPKEKKKEKRISDEVALPDVVERLEHIFVSNSGRGQHVRREHLALSLDELLERQLRKWQHCGISHTSVHRWRTCSVLRHDRMS